MMMNVSRRRITRGALLSVALSAAAAAAQTVPVTALNRQLARVDLAVSGAGEFTNNTSGPNYLGQNVNLVPSRTLAPLVQLRYTASPLKGVEFNYAFPRYTDNFTYSSFILGAQAQHAEFTLGYVAHIGSFYGLQPFVGVGGGGIDFRPTKGGGQGLLSQVRGAYYYTVGAETLIYGDHLGARVQFRQVFFGAPDYNQNYLANDKRAIASEPAFGFFLRF